VVTRNIVLDRTQRKERFGAIPRIAAYRQVASSLVVISLVGYLAIVSVCRKEAASFVALRSEDVVC